MSDHTLALIVGAAACVHDDIAKLEEMMGGPWPDAVFGVNDGGVLWTGPLDYWVTVHADELPEREQRRMEAGGEGGYAVLTPGDVPQDYRIDGLTSAGLALGVAQWKGYDRKVMVGCPFDGEGYALPHMHHGTGPWPYWRTYQESLPVLIRRHRWLPETTRSMSGFTRNTLGAPTKEWLG